MQKMLLTPLIVLSAYGMLKLFGLAALVFFITLTKGVHIWVEGSSEYILGKEGVTQGDPLSMFFDAVAVLPLIRLLKSGDRIQSWYADDSSCFAPISKIKDWFSLLLEKGPYCGYYLNS